MLLACPYNAVHSPTKMTIHVNCVESGGGEHEIILPIIAAPYMYDGARPCDTCRPKPTPYIAVFFLSNVRHASHHGVEYDMDFFISTLHTQY